jgi:Na+-transporting NADH:ubiquinone oxidoreductase subunit NqrB
MLGNGPIGPHAPEMDPRIYQIATLAGLLIYGIGWLEFEIEWVEAGLILLGATAVQWVCSWLAKLPVFEARSALISGLSLCLLLRTNSPWLIAAAVIVTIGSKFVLRWRGKHLFNPTNFGLVTMMLLTDQAVWVSPGQWGNVAFFGFLIACLGGLVVNRAARWDVTIAFLALHLALIFGRSAYLGEPAAIPLHRLQSGALLLFAFFMVSDPKTTPDSRAGRIVFAGLVAIAAWIVQFRLFATNGLLWSLAVCSFLVPLLDLLLPGTRYTWRSNPKHSPAPLPETQAVLS